jgi:hypothetical protein
MPYLNLTRGEPWAGTWAVMHFPDDAAKREVFIAKLWSVFYPIYEKTGGEPMPRSVLLSVMETAVTIPLQRDELVDRHYKGLAAGEQLRWLFALAQTEPKLAAWNTAARLVEWQSEKSRAYLYDARRVFLPVIHLWAAFILRDRRFYGDESRGYTAIDDLHTFIAEAMALLQWGMQFRLPRKTAKPPLNRQTVDFWTPPPDWSPPTPRPGWPRDGRLRPVTLEDKWVRRTRSKPVRKNLSSLRWTNR